MSEMYERIECEFCGEEFTSMEDYTAHVRFHRGLVLAYYYAYDYTTRFFDSRELAEYCGVHVYGEVSTETTDVRINEIEVGEEWVNAVGIDTPIKVILDRVFSSMFHAELTQDIVRKFLTFKPTITVSVQDTENLGDVSINTFKVQHNQREYMFLNIDGLTLRVVQLRLESAFEVLPE